MRHDLLFRFRATAVQRHPRHGRGLLSALPGVFMETMAPPKNRKIPVKTPVRLIVVIVLVCVGLLGMISYSMWYFGEQIVDARKRGVVIRKEFVSQPEDQLTIGKSGVSAHQTAGEYLIFVDVKFRDGTRKEYEVDLREPARYEAVKVGDEFDVGPYLSPDIVQ